MEKFKLNAGLLSAAAILVILGVAVILIALLRQDYVKSSENSLRKFDVTHRIISGEEFKKMPEDGYHLYLINQGQPNDLNIAATQISFLDSSEINSKSL